MTAEEMLQCHEALLAEMWRLHRETLQVLRIIESRVEGLARRVDAAVPPAPPAQSAAPSATPPAAPSGGSAPEDVIRGSFREDLYN